MTRRKSSPEVKVLPPSTIRSYQRIHDRTTALLDSVVKVHRKLASTIQIKDVTMLALKAMAVNTGIITME